MIQKCDRPGCEKAGVCRAPKSRDLNDYWFFCKEHAAEYNKNWDYFSGMTPKEVEDVWEREVFGTAPEDNSKEAKEYAKFIEDFLNGRSAWDKIPHKSKATGSAISNALKLFGLPPTASWRDVGATYRRLAKKHHPDTAKNKSNAESDFAKIAEAYKVLEKHFKNS